MKGQLPVHSWNDIASLQFCCVVSKKSIDQDLIFEKWLVEKMNIAYA